MESTRNLLDVNSLVGFCHTNLCPISAAIVPPSQFPHPADARGRARRAGPRLGLPEGLSYASLKKTRERGRVKEVTTRVVKGTAAVAALLGPLAALMRARVLSFSFSQSA